MPLKPHIYQDSDIVAVKGHIEQFFGTAQRVIEDSAPDAVKADICIIAPSDDKPYYQLVTCGMGARKMKVPKDLKDEKLERAELVMALPASWDFDVEGATWPIDALHEMAHYPFASRTWLGWGRTFNNVKPFGAGTGFTAALVTLPYRVPEAGQAAEIEGDEVNFYQVLPLYNEELLMRNKISVMRFFEVMEPVSCVVDPDRPNLGVDVTLPADIHELDTALPPVQEIQRRHIPVEEISAYNHLALFLRWMAEKGLVELSFGGSFARTLQAAATAPETVDLRVFLRDELHGRLMNHFFTEQGRAFTSWYYDYSDRDAIDEAHFYAIDVDAYAKNYFEQRGGVPWDPKAAEAAHEHDHDHECHHGHECKHGDKHHHHAIPAADAGDFAFLFIPFDEAYYQAIKEIIDKRYQEFLQ